jgi:protein-tyrosine phosphatase
MVATPHRWFGGRENRPGLLRTLTAGVEAALGLTKYGRGSLSARIKLLPGQEIPLTLSTADDLLRGDVLTLGDTGVYVLVEPPFEHLPAWTAEALGRIVGAGYRPILAHPERNAVVQSDPMLVLDFTAAGALLQITAMSITGENGPQAKIAADWILEQGGAAIIASDTHSPTWRPPNLRDAYHIVRRRYGNSAGRRICIDNPRAVASGNPIAVMER